MAQGPDLPAASLACDVAIVGYGPVGQALSAKLAQAGRSVVVLEQHQGLYPLPRAGHLDHEIARIFQGIGMASYVRDQAAPAERYELLHPDGTVLARLPRSWEAPSGWAASYHFYQPELETALDATARRAGVHVLQGHGVVSIAQSDEGVTVRAVSKEGAPVRVEARYAVGADGANSITRDAMGEQYEDLGFRADWLVVDVEFPPGNPRPDIPDTGQVLDPRRPNHMATIGERRARWEFMLMEGDDPAEIQQPEVIWQLLAPWTSPEESFLVRHTVYTFRSATVDRWRSGRLLLAGDAAHLMPPFLGQGMCSGVRDAATLSWMLDLVLRGVADPALLDSYGPSRAPHVRTIIDEAVRVGRIVCETDPVKAAVRDEELAAAPEAPPLQPSIGPAVVRPHDPGAGLLSLQPRVERENGDSALLDDVLPSGFRLLTVDEGAQAHLGPDQARALQRLGVSVARIGRPGSTAALRAADPRWGAWMDELGAVAVLIRPDFYVFGSASRWDALNALVDALGEQLCLKPV